MRVDPRGTPQPSVPVFTASAHRSFSSEPDLRMSPPGASSASPPGVELPAVGAGPAETAFDGALRHFSAAFGLRGPAGAQVPLLEAALMEQLAPRAPAYDDYAHLLEDAHLTVDGEVVEEGVPGDPRFVIDTSLPPGYTLPAEVRAFWTRHDGAELTGLAPGPGWPGPHFLPMAEWRGCEELFFHRVPLTDLDLFQGTFRPADWVTILEDPRSVGSGRGRLAMNLNPDSPRFGQVYGYSSSADGHVGAVAESFTGLLERCTEARETLASGRSLCDVLSGYGT